MNRGAWPRGCQADGARTTDHGPRTTPLPKAGAVVVNFNGGDDLLHCLRTLLAQTVALEIVLIDCASTDASRLVAVHPPAGVIGVPLPANLGFAGGCGAGLGRLGRDVDAVGFFNPDCFPEPDYFARCLELLAARPDAGGVAGRLLRPDGDRLDSCGQVLTRGLLRVRDRGYGEHAAGAYTAPAAVLAACGAAMVYRRKALEQAAVAGEVFPSDYFSFWEDLDLGWRVNNRGWRVLYEPAAVAVHRRAATAAPGSGRLTFRRPPPLAACILANRWATLARNLHPVDFVLRLPLLLGGDAVMLFLVVARRPAVLPALWHALPRVRRAWQQRSELPRRRLAELP
jgi:GT2 family glycosyltransferase